MLERFTPEGLLLAALDLVIWVAGPIIIVLVLVGLGAFAVRGPVDSPSDASGRLEVPVAVVAAGTAGAVVLIGMVAALNLIVAIPRWSPIVIVGLGVFGLARSAGRLGLNAARFGRLLMLLVGVGLIFRLGWSAPTYDAYLYHGAIVEWLAVGPVPQGFALLHSRFAFNPGLMLMMPGFRSGGADWSHLVLVEAAVVALMVLVIVSMFTLARREEDRSGSAFQLALLVMTGLFLLLRTRGTGTDLTVAFTMVAAASVAATVTRRGSLPGLFPLLGMLAALSILQKASAAAVVVLLLAPLVGSGRMSRHGRPSAPRGSVLLSLSIALVAGLAHTARTFIMSGCLAYPVAATCIEAPWATGAAATRAESTSILVWARSRSVAAPELMDLSWMGDWLVNYTGHEVLVVLAVGVLLGVIARFAATEHHSLPTATRRFLWAYVAVSATLWFVSAPNPRFGIHLHVVAAALLAVPAADAILVRIGRSGDVAPAVVRPPVLTADLRPVIGLLVAVGLVYGGTMLREGRQFPVSGTVPHAMEVLTLPFVAGGPDAVWAYEVPVGSDQCGDRVPCAPGARDLVVDMEGRRLIFLHATGDSSRR